MGKGVNNFFDFRHTSRQACADVWPITQGSSADTGMGTLPIRAPHLDPDPEERQGAAREKNLIRLVIWGQKPVECELSSFGWSRRLKPCVLKYWSFSGSLPVRYPRVAPRK
jgi:hypothetical protein